MSNDAYKEFVGETQALALEKALTHYGVEEDKLEVRVVPEDLGIGGLGGRALLLVATKDGLKAGPPPARARERDRDRDRDRGRDRDRDRDRGDRDRGRRERGGDRGRDRDREPRRAERGDRAERGERTQRPEPPSEPLVLETGELGPVGEFVERVIRSIASAGKIRIEESGTDEEVVIRVQGDGAEHLAGHAGLGAAISHLAHRAAAQLIGEDSSAYVELGSGRGPRRPSPEDPDLEALAKVRAEQVRQTGEPILLDPMSSRERFIVHNAIREVPGVVSESVEDGPGDKRIKILPE